MSERPITKYCPSLEPLERKLPLSAATAHVASLKPETGTRAAASHPTEVHASSKADAPPPISPKALKPNVGFLVYRRTNPNPFNDTLIPPFGQVLVQTTQPVPGQVYNILSVVVRNGTAQTFDASSGFSVKLSGQTQFTPILTGNEVWKPGQQFVFYVLTKKYYPIANQVTGGFVFDLGGAKSTAIPGPSGIFLRLKYNPAKFARQLDDIVAFGPGAEGGSGVKTGIADTQIYEFVSSKTERSDFGGYF